MSASRRFVFRYAFATGVALAVLPVGIAHADQTASATALNLFDQGRAEFEQKQYEQALVHFKASLQLLPSPNTRLYLARCYRALGKTASAYTNFKLAAREATDRLNASNEQRYRATQETAESEAQELASKVPHVTIKVPHKSPETLSIKLDNAELAPSAWNTSLEIDPGKHVISAGAPRYQTFLQEISIEEGQQRLVELQLTRLPTAVIALDFKIKPSGTSVQIDGKPLDPSQMDINHELDPGRHSVVVRAPGYKDFHFSQDLADGATIKVPVTLQPIPGGGGSGGTPQWVFYGVAATSVIALGAATYFALDATSRADDEEKKDPLQRDPDERDQIGDEATTANVLFIGGAALAAGAVVLAFTTDWGGSSAPPKRGSLMPIVGPNIAGLTARGSF